MGGTVISALTTVRLFDHGERTPFLITACVLALYAVVSWLVLRDAPGRTVPTTPLTQRLTATLRLPVTWQACILYAVAFGGFVAFSVFLPTYLKTAYGLSPADASNRMAGFVAVAVVMRPVVGYTVVVAGASLAANHPPVNTLGAAAFLTMAAALGAGSGATFALVAQVTEPSRVGGVTGVVGAAGGLGGFVPPLLMGWVYGQTDSYATGLWALAVTAALTLVLTVTVVRHTTARGRSTA
jgi:NNP family nitrate/nitrite transporter-like MFS transporter